MQVSVLGGMRSQFVEELRAVVKHLVVAEDLHRTALEKIDETIGEKVNRIRPLEKIAQKIESHPEKLKIKYAQYISRITRCIHLPSGTAYLEHIQKFQKTHPKSVLPEILKLVFVERCKERVEKMALIANDNCLWHNLRIEKLRKKLEEKEAGTPEHRQHDEGQPCRLCTECCEGRKRLELQVRDSRRAEILARDLWIETNERKQQEKTTTEMVVTYLVGGTVGALAGGAAAAVGNSGLTLDSVAAGAQVGPNVLNSAKGIVTGEPQFIDQSPSSKLQFRSLSARVKYAFQPDSSGPFGRNIKPWFTEPGSHTAGRVVVRLHDDVTLFFNSKSYFPIEPMIYWQFCQALGGQVLEKKLPPLDCLDILHQLEKGHFDPGNGYAPIKGVVDERLAFCSDRLKKLCEKLKSQVNETPPAEADSAKGRSDYSLTGMPVAL